MNTKRQREKVRKPRMFSFVSPFLCCCALHIQWRAAGVTNCQGGKPHLPTSLLFLHVLLIVLPSSPCPCLQAQICVMNLCADKQIYHSVMKAGMGGGLWNALAQGAGKGSVQSAMLPRTFPAATAPIRSSSVCLPDFMIHAMPQQPPFFIPVLPEPTKPAHVTGVPTKLPTTLITLA